MLHWIDWTIIVCFLLLSLGIGMYYRKAAGQGLVDFFLGGRNLPWYIAGLSMVATTFAADTPLAVTELVAQGGIAKNWLWWAFLIGGTFTTFFFANLWRRAGVLTELEFIEIRYGGLAARFLRGFRSIYLGLFMNCLIMGWVNIAMISLLEVFFDLTYWQAFTSTMVLMILALAYSALSGLKGIAITDAVQFFIAMIGCIILAILVISSDRIGGISGLQAKLPEHVFEYLPSVGSSTDAGGTFGLSIGMFLSFVAIQWWASWYPGFEPGGGGYIAQRMMSTRSEKDAVLSTLFFQIGHYCLRPWPWILVALAALALYSPQFSNSALHSELVAAENGLSLQEVSDLASLEQLSESDLSMAAEGVHSSEDFIKLFPNEAEHATQVKFHFEPRLGFVFVMKEFLPVGLIGLLLVAFIAAYMSTISTQVNWGASYLINDFIDLYFDREGERDFLLKSRLASIAVMVFAAIATPFITSISGVWEFIIQCGAGLGAVLILRWFWWRINAVSEIVAMVAPFAAYAINWAWIEPHMSQTYIEENGPYYFTVAFTTVCWLLTVFFTKTESQKLLYSFTKKIKPYGNWPGDSIASERNKEVKYLFLSWMLSIVMIYSILFSIGDYIFGAYTRAILLTLASALCGIGIKFLLKKTNIFDHNSN